MDENCIFCKVVLKKVPSKIIWEDEDFIAFLDVFPVQEGHTLFIPKKHSEYLFDLDEETYKKVFQKVREIRPKLQEAFNSKKIGLIVEGFGVPHVHIHLVPINGAHQLDSTNSHKATEEELENSFKKLQGKFS